MLIAESHEDTLTVLALALRGQGYEVDTAPSAIDAMGLLRTHRYDLVVVHHGLPDKSGTLLLKEAHEVGLLGGAAAIVISGRPDIDDLAAGHDFLRKPVDPSAFVTKVAAMLGERPPAPSPVIELALYVSPASPASERAIRNLKAVVAGFGPDRVRLSIHDLTRDAAEAEKDQVLFSPTLVRRAPAPRFWIVGDLSSGNAVLELLELSELQLAGE